MERESAQARLNRIRTFTSELKGEYAGVTMYESTYAVCTENGAQTVATEALYEGKPTD